MERKRLISKIVGTAIGLALLIGTGMISGTTAQAQGRGRWGGGHVSGRAWSGRVERRNDFRGSFDRRGGFNRSFSGFSGRERFFAPRSRVFIAPRFYSSYPGYYPYYPYGGFVGTYNYYGSGNYYGSENGGYRDGYDRGREDARDGRGYNPNNSSH